MAESTGTAVAYATKDNIVLQGHVARTEQALSTEAHTDLDARLTGLFAGGHVQADEESDVSDTAVVHTTQSGTTGQDENQVVVLPEDINGTFTLLVTDSGGASDATAGIDLDASAATVQTALDLVQTTTAGIVVTKVTGRRIFGLTWSHATEDEQNFAATVVAVTETGKRDLPFPN